MRDGRVQWLPIFVEHPANGSETGAQVCAVLIVKNIVDARNRGLQFNDALVEIVQQDTSLWREVSQFRLQIAESHILIRIQRGTRGRTLRGPAAGNNPQKIVAERAVAADDYNAVRFYRNVRLDTENNFHARGVLLVEPNILDASNRRTA